METKMKIKLDDVFYMVNRNHRECKDGNVETHRFHTLTVSGIVKHKSVYFIFINRPDNFNIPNMYRYYKADKTNDSWFTRSEGVNPLSSIIIVKDLNVNFLEILNKVYKRNIYDTKEKSKDELIDLMEGEIVEYIRRAKGLKEQLTNLQNHVNKLKQN